MRSIYGKDGYGEEKYQPFDGVSLPSQMRQVCGQRPAIHEAIERARQRQSMLRQLLYELRQGRAWARRKCGVRLQRALALVTRRKQG